MDNSLAIDGNSVMFGDDSAQNESVCELDRKPIVLSDPPQIKEVAHIYKLQKRQCWLCQKISKKISQSVKLSEDDEWHFVSCVLSWQSFTETSFK